MCSGAGIWGRFAAIATQGRSYRDFSRHNKKPAQGGLFDEDLVGETGFEPAAFSSRTRRATWLRYTPMNKILLHPFFARKPLLFKGPLAKKGVFHSSLTVRIWSLFRRVRLPSSCSNS